MAPKPLKFFEKIEETVGGAIRRRRSKGNLTASAMSDVPPVPVLPDTIPDGTSEPPRKPRYVTAPFTQEQMKALAKFPVPPPDQSPSSCVTLVHTSVTRYEREISRGASQPNSNVSLGQAAELQPSFTPIGSRAPVPPHTSRQQDLPSASSDSFGAFGLSRTASPASSTVIRRKPLPSTPSNVFVAAAPKRSFAPTYTNVVSRKPVPTASVDTSGRSPSSKNLTPSLSAVVSENTLPSTSSNVFGTPNPSKNIESIPSATVSGRHMPPSSSNLFRTRGQPNVLAPTSSAVVSSVPLPSISPNVSGMAHQSKRSGPESPAWLGADSVSSNFSDLFVESGPSVPTLSAQERFRRRFKAAAPNTLDGFGDPRPVRPSGLGIRRVPSLEDFTISQQVVESEHVSDADSYETDSCGARSIADDGSTNILDEHAPGNTFDRYGSPNVLRRQPSSNVLGVQGPDYVQREQRSNVLRSQVHANLPRREISSNTPIRQGLANIIRGEASSNVLDAHIPVQRLRGQTISNVSGGQATVERMYRHRSSNVLRGEASAQMLGQQAYSSVQGQPAGGHVPNRQPQASSKVLGRLTVADWLQREANIELEFAATLERQGASYFSGRHQEYLQSISYGDVASAWTDPAPSQEATTRNGSHIARATQTSNASGGGSTVSRPREMFESSGPAQTTDTTGESQDPRHRGGPTRAMFEGSGNVKGGIN